jgi:hypothetical protein
VAIDHLPGAGPGAGAGGSKLPRRWLALLGARKGLRVHLMATDSGIDCELVDVDDPALDARVRVADVAEAFDLARVTAAGDLLIERESRCSTWAGPA